MKGLRYFGVFLAAALTFASPASAAPSDSEVRCFIDNRDDAGLIQSFVAESCEEIGDSEPYFSLGRLVSPQSIYNASAELDCQSKSKAACIKCFNRWRSDYKELLKLMVKNKLISSQNRMWMVDALEGFYLELKTGCS